MAHEVYLRIPHRTLATCHAESRNCQESCWTGRHRTDLEIRWATVLIGAEFLEAVSATNRPALAKIIQLQENYQLATYSVPLSTFRALVSEVSSIAQDPPWHVCKHLKLQQGTPHPGAERFAFLDTWLGWREQCSQLLTIEYWCNTAGWGPDYHPPSIDVDLKGGSVL